MVPWSFVVLDRLPLNVHGKVDRKALPAPEAVSGRSYVAPRNELERRIAAAWREVLGLQQVGVHDNLFELGGSSLVIVKLHTRLEQDLGRALPIMDLFRNTTIDALARHLTREEGQEAGAAAQARARTEVRRESLERLSRTRARRQGRTKREE
jgi:acyl carrier protein